MLCGPERAVLPVSPKAYELLNVLVDARPAAISKSDLHARLWPDVFVSDVRLAGVVSELRRALHEKDGQSAFVRTVHGFGYAFSADAADGEAPPPGGVTVTTNWLVYNRREVSLPDGEHILGRADELALHLPSPTVSRHHAVIRIVRGQATIEDLGSKNGTFVDGQPVTSSICLADGARIQIGGFELTYRSVAPAASTETQVKG